MRTLSTSRRKVEVVLAMIPVMVNAAPALAAIRRRDDEDDDKDKDDDDKDDDDKDNGKEDDYDDDDKKDNFTSIDLGFEFTSVEAPWPTETTYPPRQTRTVDEGERYRSPERTTSEGIPRPTTGPQFGALPVENENWDRETTYSSRRRTTTTTSIDEPESTAPSTTSSSTNTALPDGVSDDFGATPSPQVGESADHIRMEIGIGIGVVVFFLVLSVGIFLWLKRRGRGNGSMWGTIKSIGRRRGYEDRGPIEPSMSHTTYESRAVGDRTIRDRDEWPVAPDAAVLSNNDVKHLSQAISDIDGFNTLRRKYTISRSMDIPAEKPTPPPAARRGSNNSYVTMTVGGHLPHIPSSGFDNSFIESIDGQQQDPFADPYSPTTSSIPPAPPPLRFPVKPIAPTQTGRTRAMHKYNASDETLELTDPRILSPGGRLVITNRSRQDSVPSIPPSPPRKGVMRRSSNVVPLPLRVNRDQPPRHPWNGRESGVSVESEGPARHRGVKSWVNHEVEIREKYPAVEEVDSPRYAKSEATLYNRYSVNSGMDTRRTEYEY